MKCPSCGAAELVHDTRDLPYTLNGEATVIPEVCGDFCPACHEVMLDACESNRVSGAMLAFQQGSLAPRPSDALSARAHQQSDAVFDAATAARMLDDPALASADLLDILALD